MEQKKKQSPQKKGNKRLILLLDAILVLCLIAAAVVLVVNLSGSKGNGESTPPVSDVGTAPADQQASGQPSEGVGSAAAPAGSAAQQAYGAALAFDSAGMLTAVDFAALNEAGVAAMGWLYAPNTPISYPVMQYVDNEYYMERNEQDKKDKNGAIYLDCRNAKELVDAQVMIYGNPMADGSMFGSLAEYRNQSYFAEHPTLYLYTGDTAYRIDVFAVNTASPAMSNYPTWFETDSSRATYINGLRDASLIQSDMTIAADATLIALVTTSDFDEGEDSRIVVHGVLSKD